MIGVFLALAPAPALAGDSDICLDAADKAKAQGPLEADEKQKAHEACQRALADSSNVVSKYQLQEADFDIVGRPPQ